MTAISRTLPAPGPSIGIVLDYKAPAGTVLDQARAAEEQGFGSLWLGDHLIDFDGSHSAEGPLDAFTLMTAIGAVTRRVRLGWVMLNTGFRPPALLAKQLATLDHITEGRVLASLGAGWLEAEYAAYDAPFLADHDARVVRSREVVELFRALWTAVPPERVTYDGDHVRVADLPFSPVPHQRPYPPIWVGGDSDATLDLVRDLADGWVTNRHGSAKALAAIRATSGWPQRPLSIATLGRLTVAATDDEALARARAEYGAMAGTPRAALLGTFEQVAESAIIGSPETCVQRLHELLDAGLTDFLIPVASPAVQAEIAELLLPALAGSGSGSAPGVAAT